MHLMLRIGREINAEKFLVDLCQAIFFQHKGDYQSLKEARKAAGLDGPPTQTERVKFIRRVVEDSDSVADRMMLVLQGHRERDNQDAVIRLFSRRCGISPHHKEGCPRTPSVVQCPSMDSQDTLDILRLSVDANLCNTPLAEYPRIP